MDDFDMDIVSALMANGESREEAEEEVRGVRVAEIDSDYSLMQDLELEFGRMFG